MGRKPRRWIACGLVALTWAATPGGAGADAAPDGDGDLTRAVQNPVSDLMSIPFQNNMNFDFGPKEKLQNVLNIQPVVPFHLTEDWNLITRTIIPLISQPQVLPSSREFEIATGNTITPVLVRPGDLPGSDREFGLGDINLTTFLAPAEPGEVIWGAGPSFLFPSATDEVLGTEKWAAGPALVVLTMPGKWVLGTLVTQLWSFAGDGDRASVDRMTLQYFVNYNLPGGWYLTTSPIITANWEADSDERWTVPLGGGFGRLFRVGQLPVNAQVQAYYNVEKPRFGPDWALRLQLQFVLPTLF